MLYPEPLSILIMITATTFGLMVGSFLNVCIYRLPKEHISIVTPRSHCPHCGKLIVWYDNIPVLSWLSLGGACRHCAFPISIRYTFVEILCGLLFLAYTWLIVLAPSPESIFFQMKPFQRWVSMSIAGYLICVMVTLTFIDFDYFLIPNSLTYPGIVLAPIVSAIFPFFHITTPLIENQHISGFIASIIGMIVGGGSLYFVRVVGKIIFRKEAMGFGDVTMMTMVGGFLGWDAALLIFFMACLIGSVFGILTMIVTKSNYIPFGPYLAIGTLLSILYKSQIIDIVVNKWPILLSQWLEFSNVVY